jgi:hypothetical protein
MTISDIPLSNNHHEKEEITAAPENVHIIHFGEEKKTKTNIFECGTHYRTIVLPKLNRGKIIATATPLKMRGMHLRTNQT